MRCLACRPRTITLRGWATVAEVIDAILDDREPEIDQDFIELARRVHEAQHRDQAEHVPVSGCRSGRGRAPSRRTVSAAARGDDWCEGWWWEPGSRLAQEGVSGAGQREAATCFQRPGIRCPALPHRRRARRHRVEPRIGESRGVGTARRRRHDPPVPARGANPDQSGSLSHGRAGRARTERVGDRQTVGVAGRGRTVLRAIVSSWPAMFRTALSATITATASAVVSRPVSNRTLLDP
jgi:hypothetical protein